MIREEPDGHESCRAEGRCRLNRADGLDTIASGGSIDETRRPPKTEGLIHARILAPVARVGLTANPRHLEFTSRRRMIQSGGYPQRMSPPPAGRLSPGPVQAAKPGQLRTVGR